MIPKVLWILLPRYLSLRDLMHVRQTCKEAKRIIDEQHYKIINCTTFEEMVLSGEKTWKWAQEMYIKKIDSAFRPHYNSITYIDFITPTSENTYELLTTPLEYTRWLICVSL